ncbi:MAG TPA: hypothetical protein PLI09_16940 [Candidatus Hydrogenedentes bacterium]|nr:hypothetical protein [Candidatus Hydrogenedentota bacterium]
MYGLPGNIPPSEGMYFPDDIETSLTEARTIVVGDEVAMVGAFANDHRVAFWNLYNEPGNSGMGNKSLPLMEAAFAWVDWIISRNGAITHSLAKHYPRRKENLS